MTWTASKITADKPVARNTSIYAAEMPDVREDLIIDHGLQQHAFRTDDHANMDLNRLFQNGRYRIQTPYVFRCSLSPHAHDA